MALVGSLSASLGSVIAVTGSFVPGTDNLFDIGTSSEKWKNIVSTAITGSLTKLANGSDYLRAGNNVTLTTGSSGEVTIAATSVATTPGGIDRNIQFNGAGAFDGDNELSWSGTVLSVTGSVSASQGITGSDLFATNLTSTQVVFAGAGGKLSSDSGMTYNAGSDVLTVGTSTFGQNVTIAGDLTVNGTTTTINTENLIVEDKLIIVASSSSPGVNNGGIAIFSGSFSTGTDLVIGRAGGDIWGVGSYDTQLGTDTNTFNMTMVPMRALEFQVKESTATGATYTVLKSSGDTLIASGSTVTLSGSTVDFVKDGIQIAYVGVSPDSITGIIPSSDKLYNLGSPQRRWDNIYTGDLHLRNERGDYTLIEEEDFLSIRFNKTGKRYKFVLEPVPELDEK